MPSMRTTRLQQPSRDPDHDHDTPADPGRDLGHYLILADGWPPGEVKLGSTRRLETTANRAAAESAERGRSSQQWTGSVKAPTRAPRPITPPRPSPRAAQP